MEIMVNEYEYTPEISAEAVGAWWQQKFRNGYVTMIILIILIPLMQILAIFFIGRFRFLLAFEIFPIAVIILFRMKQSKAIQTERERMEVLFENGTFVYRIEFGSEIHTTSLKGENCIKYEDIEDFSETRNLIVLFLKGSMTLALHKEGFQKGSKEECIDFLKKKINI